MFKLTLKRERAKISFLRQAIICEKKETSLGERYFPTHSPILQMAIDDLGAEMLSEYRIEQEEKEKRKPKK